MNARFSGITIVATRAKTKRSKMEKTVIVNQVYLGYSADGDISYWRGEWSNGEITYMAETGTIDRDGYSVTISSDFDTEKPFVARPIL